MKKIILILTAIPILAIAQKKKTTVKTAVKTEKKVVETGVHFLHKVASWETVLTQAQKENKYIFVDCFTTWCGPCKYVSTKVFPLKNVGDYFNKNFVNVGLQIDATKKDNADVIATRTVAKHIETTYKITAYPTFLIFDNTGKLVHKFVGAGDDKMMLANAEAGLNKEEQYYTLVEKFEIGNRDANFITKLCKAAATAGDNAEEYLKAFIKSQDNLFTKDNAELLLSNVENTNGIAFKSLYDSREKWFSVIDKKQLEGPLVYAIEEEVYDYMAKDKNDKADWNKIEEFFRKKYDTYGGIAVAKVKVMSSLQNNDFAEFEKAIKQIIEKYPNAFTNIGELNEFAWIIFENINDKELLNQALNWSKMSLEKEELGAYLDTYANLLYKLGKKDEAIEAETRALSKAANDDEKKSYQAALNKMKKGEKTWK